jgi:hypothetical protein
MQFKVKAKTMFVDGEAGKTREREEVFVVPADRYALMDEKSLIELIEEIEEYEPADEEKEVVDAEAAEEPTKPKRSRKTTKDDA